jgi:hypothetical protein
MHNTMKIMNFMYFMYFMYFYAFLWPAGRFVGNIYICGEGLGHLSKARKPARVVPNPHRVHPYIQLKVREF